MSVYGRMLAVEGFSAKPGAASRRSASIQCQKRCRTRRIAFWKQRRKESVEIGVLVSGSIELPTAFSRIHAFYFNGFHSDIIVFSRDAIDEKTRIAGRIERESGIDLET